MRVRTAESSRATHILKREGAKRSHGAVWSCAGGVHPGIGQLARGESLRIVQITQLFEQACGVAAVRPASLPVTQPRVEAEGQQGGGRISVEGAAQVCFNLYSVDGATQVVYKLVFRRGRRSGFV